MLLLPCSLPDSVSVMMDSVVGLVMTVLMVSMVTPTDSVTVSNPQTSWRNFQLHPVLSHTALHPTLCCFSIVLQVTSSGRVFKYLTKHINS